MKELKVRIVFTEECLGTKAANPDVFADFIASKHPDGVPAKDELDSAEHCEERGSTLFHRNEDGRPILWDYQIKGFCKDTCGAMRRATGSKSSELKAYKTVIDQELFVNERTIPMELPPGAPLGLCERPLRGDTAQGPRVTVCRSETVPAGTCFTITFKLLQDSLMPYLREWLDYGSLRGIGAWRNSGKGRFSWSEV